MEQLAFGRTSLRVSEIGFGGWAIGGDAYGATDDDESIRAIHRALDLGCTFFDTADAYGDGRSEALLGKALRDLKPAPAIATKGGGRRRDYSYPALKEACEASLARLRRDAIDLYQLHNPRLDQIESGIETLFRLKASGLIRYGGVSIRTAEEGLAALDGVDSIQTVYHMLNHSTARGDLFAKADEAGVAVIAREPLANGFLCGRTGPFGEADWRAGWPDDYRRDLARRAEKMKFLVREDRTAAQSALRFVLANEHVAAAIPGIKTVAQAEENLRTPSTPPLTMSELEQIFEITAGCGDD